jgi:glycosyltransferase involved in cell wall biosynthesis
MTSRLVIGQILSSFDVGGQERVALDLAAELRRRGNEVIAVSLAPPPDGPLADAFRDRGIATTRVAKRRGFDASLYARLLRLFRREHVSVVHTHNPQPLIYAALPARLAGATAIHTKHGANPGSAASRRLRRTAALAANAFVAVSEETALQALAQNDCVPEQLRIVANGIDLSRFRPDPEARHAVRAALGIPEDAWLVGSVGRLDPAKNYELLMHACAPLLNDDFRLAIVGGGPCAQALRECARGLGIDRFVHLLGQRMDVPQLLAAFDTFALSSITEGLPLVVPEAMASGLPVVSTAVGGLREVVAHGDTGYLVPPNAPRALRKRLEDLRTDPMAAAEQGRRGRAVALAKYSSTRMADDYLQVYRQARLAPEERQPCPAP